MATNGLHEGFRRLQAEQYAEALQCFDQVLAVDPDNGAALTYKGAALGGLRRYAEGAQCCGRAININPQDANAIAMMGSIQLDWGHWEADRGHWEAGVACLQYAQRLGHQGAAQYLVTLQHG
jgi:tetratricopeptide (TPR) repeat protein